MAYPYDRRDWFQHLFLTRNSMFRLILPKVLFFTAFAAAITYLISRGLLPHLPIAYFTVIGIALGLMLTFRTNNSYDRYWEGRKAWGMIVNRCRNFVRQVGQQADAEVCRESAVLIAVFAYASKRQLWRSKENPEVIRLLGEERAKWFLQPPAAAQNALTALSALLRKERERGTIQPIDQERMEADLAVLIDMIGVCERIQSTPIPLTFVVYLRRLLLGFCSTIPLALYDSLHWWVPAVTCVIAYVFIGLDRSGVEIEDPFEPTVYGLDLDGICRKIESDAFANAERAGDTR